MSEPHPHHYRLHHLPFAARLCLGCFLVSVGVGYVSALVQLHLQHASPGDLLPQMKDVVKIFHGPRSTDDPRSHMERVITADEGLPFNGSGQMSAAFTAKSEIWKGAIKARARDMQKRQKRGAEELDQAFVQEAEKRLREERAGERDALASWIQAGASESEYGDDKKFCLPPAVAGRPITEKYIEKDDSGVQLKVKSLIDDRCARCHRSGTNDPAGNYTLETYSDLKKYLKVTNGPAMSLEKLTQSTHVHLLSFSMLYMLTGLLVALTRYPGFVRIPLASVPLVVQLYDIACWWLARIPGTPGERFAEMIPVTGGIVGVGLLLQILLTLFDLFGRWGRIVLVLLIAAAGYGGYEVATKVVMPHVAAEKAAK